MYKSIVRNVTKLKGETSDQFASEFAVAVERREEKTSAIIPSISSWNVYYITMPISPLHSMYRNNHSERYTSYPLKVRTFYHLEIIIRI